jgi:SAM-dependent methyltransferase
MARQRSRRIGGGLYSQDVEGTLQLTESSPRSSPHRASFDAADAEAFLAASAAWPPRATLLAALDRLAARQDADDSADRRLPLRAVDLGCGAGTETLELLRRGWAVHAVDAHRSCLDFTRRRAEKAGLGSRLSLECREFEELVLPSRSYALAHAGFSLPFCRAEAFGRLWNRITASVLPSGCFAGQLFGEREPLMLEAPRGSVTSHDRSSIVGLLGEEPRSSWTVVSLEEIDRPGRGPRGDPKHWHVFHAVLERTNAPSPREGDDGACSAS